MRLTSFHKLLLICVGALVFRLVLLQFVHYPGIADPTHYYNMGVRLVEGHGFTIDYIWMYSQPPESIVHPEEHWMPLTAALAAVPMAIFGESARAALLPFVLLGSLLPLLSYWAAKQLDLSENSALFAAAVLAVLPEFALYSLRTDTVIPCALFECGSILLLIRGLRRGGWLPFVGSGVMAGLAYLTRNDGALLLPMLVVTLAAYRLWSKAPFHWRGALLIPPVALLVVAPWLARNLNDTGMLGSSETSSMMFFTDHADHYAFGRKFTLETLLAAQTPAQLIGKRAFELAAAIKTIIESFDAFSAVTVAGGLILLVAARDRRRLLALAPVLILLLGLLVAYPVLIPYKAQAGSFKKAYMSILPLLLPLGAYAFERAISDARIRYGAMALVIGLLGVNALDAVRLDAQNADRYLAGVQKMADQARTLPDTNGDGAIILMTQDPFIVRYVGLQSVMFPSEPLDVTIEVARRYGVDYLLLPADRPALDAILSGEVSDPRFVPVESVPGTPFTFYAIRRDGASG